MLIFRNKYINCFYIMQRNPSFFKKKLQKPQKNINIPKKVVLLLASVEIK